MSNIIELSDDGKVAIEMLRYHRAKIAEHKEAEAEFLLKWTGGRVPVFKTDANDMGRTWLYV